MSSELDELGSHLMRKVRDETVEQWQDILSGKMRGDAAQQARALAQGIPSDVLLKLGTMLIDRALHNLLWADEQGEMADPPRVLLVVERANGIVVAHQESDGLSGELYTEDGWLARYSRFPEHWTDAGSDEPS